MKMMRALVSAGFALVGAAHANLITNGDFEAGNTGFDSDFSFNTSGSPAAVYDVRTSPFPWNSAAANYGDNTSGSGLMMTVNGSTQSDDVFWRQTVNVSSQTDYDFSVFVSTWFGGPASLFVSVNGTRLGPNFFSPATTASWEKVSRSWNSGLSTIALIEIGNDSTSFSGNDFAIDDLSFVGQPGNEVPIPGAGLLLASALGGLALRRKARH